MEDVEMDKEMGLNKMFSILRHRFSQNTLKKLENYPHACIKGEALSLHAYGKLGCRTSSDIDILIDKKEIVACKKILFSEGFQYKGLERELEVTAISSSHQTPPFIKKTVYGNIVIDLNFDVFWGEYTGARVDISEFISDAYEVDIYGCSVKILPPMKSLIQVALHHYNHMNAIYHIAGNNAFGNYMFRDIYYLWKNNVRQIKIRNLYSLAEQYGAVPYIFYVLKHTNEIYKDKYLEKWVEAFKTEEGINLLHLYGLAENERREWKVDFLTRISTSNTYDLIKSELTDSDLSKLERARNIFQ